MNKRFQRGEIATILAVGALVVLGITAVVTSVVVQKNKQTIKTKAAEEYSCIEYFYEDSTNCTGTWKISKTFTSETNENKTCETVGGTSDFDLLNDSTETLCVSVGSPIEAPVPQLAQPSFTCTPPNISMDGTENDSWECHSSGGQIGTSQNGRFCCIMPTNPGTNTESSSSNTNPPSDLYWYFDKSWNGCVKVTDLFDDKAHCERDLASWARGNATVASNITLTPTCYTSLDSCKTANPPPAPPPPTVPALTCEFEDIKIVKEAYNFAGCPNKFIYREPGSRNYSKEVCCKPNPQSAPAQSVQPVPVVPPPPASPGSPETQPGTVPGLACALVITYAVSPQGVCQQFPNACIPAGWKLVPNCSAQPAPPVNLPVPAPQVPISCQNTKSKGDADCNASIDDTDYSIWLNEYLKKTSLNADFYADGKVDLVDFEIWRRNHFDLQTAPIGGGRDD